MTITMRSRNIYKIVVTIYHILNDHRNEDKMSAQQSQAQFKWIYDQLHNIEDNSKINNVSCDIGNCKAYARNNREGEKQNIDCNDSNVLVKIHIMDTIHYYFIHSVDIGYRIVQQPYEDTEEYLEAYNPLRNLHNPIGINGRN